MTTATIEEVQSRLIELIAGLKPGEEILITENDCPVARLVGGPAAPRKTRRLGGGIGKLKIIEEDEEHLEDFREYMP